MVKNKRLAQMIAGVALGSCVLFSPWLVIGGKDAVNRAATFWLPEMTWKDVPGFIAYVFMPDANKFSIGWICVIVFYATMVYLFMSSRREEEVLLAKYNRALFIAPFVVLGIGTIMRAFIWPVFQPRYTLPSLGCLWLAFSIALAMQKDKKYIFNIILVFLLGISFINCYKNIKDEIGYKNNMDNLYAFFENVEDEDIVLVDDWRYEDHFKIYWDKEILIYEDDNYGLEDIEEWKQSGYNIYFFDLFAAQGDDSDFIKKASECYEVEYIGEYGLEYLFSSLYEIK